MNKINLIFGGLLLLAASCGENTENPDGRPSSEQLKEEITQTDDSLTLYYGQVMDGKRENVPVSTLDKAIERHLVFYNYYPKDEFAPESLDKVHQLYLQKKEYAKSARMCDTLIKKYPDYKNRKDVYLSAASTYDYMLRDTVNAKKFYNLLLKSPNLDKDTKQSVAFRLKHIHLTFDEMVELQMKNISSK